MVTRHAHRLLGMVARPGWQSSGIATRTGGLMKEANDKILLQGLVFHGRHGVLQGERELGQKFVVDTTLTTDLSKAGSSDELSDTVDYASVYGIKFGNSYCRDIKSIIEGKPRQLIECVAEDIAKTILTGYPTVTSVQVRVQKPHVAVHGVLDALGVEITRSRID